MSEKPPSEVLGALPRTRPHRRSEKRGGRRAAEGNGGAGTAAQREPEAPPAMPAQREAEAQPATPARREPEAEPATPARREPETQPDAPANAPAMPAAGASKPKPVAKRPKRQTVPGQKPAQRAASTPPADEPPRAPRTPRSRPKPRAERLRQPPQPAGTPPTPRSRKPVPATGADIIGTAVQAAAELAEIGLTVSARALRNAVARLPKP